MTDEVVARVAASARYRDVDASLLRRLAAEELARSRNADEATKRVKRRLHQAVGAFRGALDAERLLAPLRSTWAGEMADPAFREACRAALALHASTQERVARLESFFAPIWELTGGPPRTLLDQGCGLGPLMLPWMSLAGDANYIAVDADRRTLGIVEAFLELVGQPHEVVAADLAAGPPDHRADVALLLKLAPTLERQHPGATERLLRGLHARHAVVSFPSRSLGRRSKGMEATYRSFVEELGGEQAEASVPGELVFVLTLPDG